MPNTTVTALIGDTFSSIKEDWKMLVWVWVAQMIGVLLMIVAMIPFILIGFLISAAAVAADSPWLMGTLMTLGIIIFVLGGNLLWLAVNSFYRAGVIGVLRVRKPGMKTDFGTFVDHGKAGFKQVFKAQLPSWYIVMPIILLVALLIGGIALLIGGLESVSGGMGDDAIAVVVLLAIIGFFGMFLLILPIQIVVTLTARYAAYVALKDVNLSGWNAFKGGFAFFKKNIGAVIGLAGLFLLVLMAANFAMQIVTAPLNLLAAIPILAMIIGIPVSLFIVAASAGLQSGIVIWEEAASMKLYDERK